MNFLNQKESSNKKQKLVNETDRERKVTIFLFVFDVILICLCLVLVFVVLVLLLFGGVVRAAAADTETKADSTQPSVVV